MPQLLFIGRRGMFTNFNKKTLPWCALHAGSQLRKQKVQCVKSDFFSIFVNNYSVALHKFLLRTWMSGPVSLTTIALEVVLWIP